MLTFSFCKTVIFCCKSFLKSQYWGCWSFQFSSLYSRFVWDFSIINRYSFLIGKKNYFKIPVWEKGNKNKSSFWFSRKTRATESRKINWCKRVRQARFSSSGSKWPFTGEIVWDVIVIIISLKSQYFYGAAGCVPLQETPWGFMARLLGGSNKKIDVEILCKWKLLFSTKSRELWSTLAHK